MRTLGIFLLIVLAKGAGLKLMRDSLREARNKAAYERMVEQRRQNTQRLQRVRESVQRQRASQGRTAVRTRAEARWAARGR